MALRGSREEEQGCWSLGPCTQPCPHVHDLARWVGTHTSPTHTQSPAHTLTAHTCGGPTPHTLTWSHTWAQIHTHTCIAQPCTHVFPPTECQHRRRHLLTDVGSHTSRPGVWPEWLCLARLWGRVGGLGPCPAAAGAPAPSREPRAGSGSQGCSSSQDLCLWGSLVAPKFSVVLWTLLSCKCSEGATPAGDPRPRRSVPPQLLTDPP